MRDLSGQQIRGYQVRELIGAGGFAAVYRAYQPAVEREVAVKVILPRYANNPDFVRRFETEAQLVARLEHMHIVPLYDYWREPDNAYLVMRWLRGGTLYDSLVNDGAWSLEDTARLLEQIAAALMVAHRGGIIHQDLTPANILLDEERNAFLADFGIAKDLLDFTESLSSDRPVFGSPAYMAPEQITGTYISIQSDIYSLGIILFHMLTGQLPFDAPDHTTLIRQQVQAPMPPLQSVRSDLSPTLNAVVMRAAAKSPGARYPNAMSLATDFRQALQALGIGTAYPTGQAIAGDDVLAPDDAEVAATRDLSSLLDEPQNPYKGLRAFEEADAAHFFGRDDLIQHVCQRIGDLKDRSRLLAIVGPSGSGKSSLVKAGVIPALRRGAVAGSEHWFVARMVPGPYPLAELEMALLGVTFDAPQKLTDLLHDKSRGLAAVVQQMLPDDDSELVLFIDQFEEVFTLVEWEDERREFLQTLERGVTAPGSRLRLVIALRADFYDRPLLYPAFGELVRANTEVVLPLDAANLRQAIIEPAHKELLEIEGDAVDVIVSEVGAEPGALPLLQYALTELYERREDRTMTLAAYRESGGVSGALARRAEDVFGAMVTTHQQVVRQLFLRLVTIGDNTADTRRRVRLSDLMSMQNIAPKIMRAVLDEFGRYRLLTFDHDPQTREPTVEVAHEALVTRWERLRQWLNQSRANLRVQRQLAFAASEWHTADQDDSFLARGARLVQFEALLATDDVALTQRERDFLSASIQARQRAIWRQRAFMVALAAITLLALLAAGFAWDRQQRAERAQATTIAERDRADNQARIARSGELAITALTNSEQIDRALLLSIEALHAAQTFDARESLLTLLQTQPHLVTMLHDHPQEVRSAAASPDGQWFATGDRAGIVLLWNADSHRVAHWFTVPTAEPVNAVAFAPDSELLAVGSADTNIYLWTLAEPDTAPQVLAGHEDAVWDIAFSPDGQLLASGSADTGIRLWDLTSATPESDVLGNHDDFVFAVAFSPDGDLIASGGADNTVRMWDVDERAARGEPLTGHTNWVFGVAFSPDGQLLASASADNTIRLWDVDSGDPALADPLSGHSDWVRDVAFNAAGLLASASADGTVRLWDSATAQAEVLAAHQDAVWGLAFSPDGQTIISGSEDTDVLVWTVNRTGLQRQTLLGHQEAVARVAVSPDGSVIASAGGEPLGRGTDNTIRLWDAASGDPLAVLEGHTTVVTDIAITPDGSTLASCSADGTIRLWALPDGETLMPPLTTHNSLLMAVAISPDGQWMASGGIDGTLMLWDLANGEPAADPIFAHTTGITDLAFSPDSTVLAVSSEDGTISLWNPLTRAATGDPLVGHEDIVTRLAFSPDGALLASGSRDLTIILWDWRSGTVRAQLTEGHTRRITALAFNPTGDLLASGSQDTTIRVWDMATLRPLGAPVAAHDDWITDLAFTPYGTLISGSWDTRVVEWRMSIEQWETRACALANRSMTTDEWALYMPDSPYVDTCTTGSGPIQ